MRSKGSFGYHQEPWLLTNSRWKFSFNWEDIGKSVCKQYTDRQPGELKNLQWNQTAICMEKMNEYTGIFSEWNVTEISHYNGTTYRSNICFWIHIFLSEKMESFALHCAPLWFIRVFMLNFFYLQNYRMKYWKISNRRKHI